MSNKIEGIPEGWELVAFRKARCLNWFIDSDGGPKQWLNNYKSSSVFAIIRKIEKPKQYRPFANAAEYVQHWGKPVNWKIHTEDIGLFAVISVNNVFCWVAFGNAIKQFDWRQAFEKLQFSDGTVFGVEVKDE